MSDSVIRPGLALRVTTASVSPVAANVRVADIAANPGSYEIAVKPKSFVDQLDLPCCVSCALTAAMETLDSSSPQLSPLFHYHVTRFDNFGADGFGSLYLEDGLATLTDDGICRQDLHDQPFFESAAEIKPMPAAYSDGGTRALGRVARQARYHSAEGFSRAAWAREQLRLDRPAIIAFNLPASYPTSILDPPYTWSNPEQFEISTSGHCVLAIGYDDVRRCFRIHDSMGSAKFDQGCWWMGYRVIDSSIVQDVYCLLP